MGLGFIIMGWLGILIYLFLIFTANKLEKNGETALLHLIICFVFIFFTPLPLYLSFNNHNPIFWLSSIFVYLFLIMIIITMALQVGHLSYSNKQLNNDKWQERDNWMIHGMLGDVFESIVNVVFHIWILLLAIGFFIEDEFVMAAIMTVFSLFIIRNLFILLNVVIKKPMRLFQIFKMNSVITTLETFIFFVVLVCWMTFYL
ncbi:hypothetical protein RVS70_05070 [Virgibacillus sp. M23]|uniref:hypothetical protein n=1 Tax=Virgibacillus sp. M23 TaxID=3079030 RepID=UPI002A91E1DF|nr:hypothetical protein [Virgibacillus sp. M23]MDY7043571.1 hypothetical protein [Virgibacillus sp. M23]